MAAKIEGTLKPAARGHGGVHVAHHKNLAKTPVVRMPAPATVVLPMSMHIGAPCEPVVKKGDPVKVGQLVGDSDKFVSAPIYASVSGTVKSVGPVRIAQGRTVTAVTIESDGKMEDAEFEVPEVNTKEDFLKAVRKSGLVGLGGAGFPTHVKLNFKPDAKVDTLIVNIAECEPYITVNHRECLEHTNDILEGLCDIKKWIPFENIFIAIEDNKPDAVRAIQKAMASKKEWNGLAKIVMLKSSYPQGAEKVMIHAVTGRKVPPGKIPADVGCVVMNVESVTCLARYLRTGKPLVSRSLTVDGSAIKEPKNLRVPIGVKVQDVIDYCGGFKADPYKVFMGGPMMGITLDDLNVPVVKNNNAIIAFADGAMKVKKTRACIRCGRCVQACPMSLEPTKIERKAHLGDVEALKKAGAMVCMECGSCAYACPSGRPLVQYMKLSKQLIREAGAK
ncbi:MAG: electron transport complex subunit RsxC [Oscillospiraceae bacterium]|nr:electron transport complex subunit RsxC [Oscillospiraceae bacterium]